MEQESPPRAFRESNIAPAGASFEQDVASNKQQTTGVGAEHDDEQQAQGRQIDALRPDTIAYIQKVYTTLGMNVAICGGAGLAASTIQPLFAISPYCGLAGTRLLLTR
jgi:hypothetical protein